MAKKRAKRTTKMATRKSPAPVALLPIGEILPVIHRVRGVEVILDADLATLYKVETKVLLQAVKRNLERFPTRFMFQLTADEWTSLESQIEVSSLRSQSVTSKRGGRRYAPYVFTEQGVAMLSSVLRSKRAIQVNIAIMDAFVQMRRALASEELLLQVAELERKYGRKFKDVFEALHEFKELFRAIYLLLSPPPPEPKSRPIGFGAYQDDDEDDS